MTEAGLHGVFQYLGNQPIAFILLAMALGSLIGRLSLRGVSLGTTAGTLLSGIVVSVIAQSAFGITYSIPGVLSSFFLLLFMYALGLRVGPQFFAGLRSGGLAFVAIGIIVWSLNWIICMAGAWLAGLEPGYATGLISGSYTITAILGVGQNAIDSGAYVPPPGISPEQIGANMAGAYAISYVLSSVGIILLIRYLPQIFGHDPVADAQSAEREFSGGDIHPAPGSPDALTFGFSPYDVRAFRLTHHELVGRCVSEIETAYPSMPIVHLLRNEKPVDVTSDPILTEGDIVTVRADVHDLIFTEGTVIGPEVDTPEARRVPLVVADIHVGSHSTSGRTVGELTAAINGGVVVEALFRGGHELPLGPDSEIRFGDTVRLTGTNASIQKVAQGLGGQPVLPTMKSEIFYLALAMFIGYVVGTLTMHIGGIPIALGTSAGCILMGIFVSYMRSRNPSFGGPVHEGARNFLQDFGLNAFVAVLSANVGPKVVTALAGDTALWLALIGITAALLPPLIAFWVGIRMFGLNAVIADGAATGARNSTPGLNAIVDQSRSSIAAVAYPVTYAITTVLALIGGYFSMILS
ncbi:aspartate:alanine exchanger family transporter [Aliiruegeria haliotis]|uniref:aspartate:alanine exchanger family transporter n=1 Tax=Aliiruegeria haliotis TaxID=1280846 RepID=UPI001FE36EB8|nr:transporter [Aliiruegeria haliotis]